MLVGAVVVVALAVTVITDLPQSASRAVQIREDTTVVNSVNSLIESCAFAARETFEIYHDEQQHSLTSSEKARVPSLLSDDQNACSFTSENIFNLSNVEVPGSGASQQMQRLVGTVTNWATADSLAAIEAVQDLTTNPKSAAALQHLAHAQAMMASDRSLALREVTEADTLLHGRLPAVQLPAVS